MARHKDVNWQLPDGEHQPDGSHTHLWNSIHAALLMDIRDELQLLTAVICAKNTAKKRKAKR